MYLKLIVLLFVAHSAFSEDSLLKPCPVEDMKCLSETTENFLDKTAAGIPAYDIRPIDPLFIHMVCSDSVVDSVTLHFKNVTVTGLRKQNITDFKMDTSAKSVLLAVTTDLNVNSDIAVEYKETQKTFNGNYKATLRTKVTSQYNYEVKADDKGVEHFEGGPETLTCEIVTIQSELNKELMDAVMNDEHARKIYTDNQKDYDTHRRKHACDIVKTAFATVMHNMRAAAKAFPKSYFFTNV